jgi:LemA protein
MSDFYNQESSDLRDRFKREYEAQQAEAEHRLGLRTIWLIGCTGVLLLLFLIIGGSACATYNSLQYKREKVRQQWSNVDIQLQRRADLIPNLVETVKGYARHEEKVFDDIAQARSRLLNAQTPQEKAAANDQLSSALGRLLVIAENYPSLQASEQFKNLQYELAGTENRIAVARRDYNDAVVDYNTSLQRFPTILMARLLGFERAEEFKAEPASREVPKVSF